MNIIECYICTLSNKFIIFKYYLLLKTVTVTTFYSIKKEILSVYLFTYHICYLAILNANSFVMLILVKT